MELVNLKSGTDTFQDENGETKTRDDYPWGLSIELNNETLTKLKATPQPAGTEVMITAKAIIRSTSTRDTEEGMQHNASLQITDMAISPATEQAPERSTAEVMYGSGGE
ncbi:hypothetical protein ABVS80_001138 [Escherichia coli]|nr:hypothetical protein [Escherichia coli]